MQQIEANGTATVTQVGSGGSQTVAGISYSATLQSGGTQTVEAGGQAGNAIVQSGGLQQIDANGKVYDTQINSSGLQVDSGIAYRTTVLDGGTQQVESGAVENSGTVAAGGTQTVDVGGTANSVRLSGGMQLLSGQANDTIVQDGGTQAIVSGAVASFTKVLDGGTQNINASGTAIGTQISGGSETVSSGGLASATVLNPGGTLAVQAGGTAAGALLYAATEAISGASFNDTLINRAGVLNVDAGAQVSGTQIYSGGTQNVGSGGSAGATVLNLNGTLTVQDGGLVTDTVLNGATSAISGATFTDTQINSAGTLDVYAGATVDGTTALQGTLAIRQDGALVQNVEMQGGTVQFVPPDEALSEFAVGAVNPSGIPAFQTATVTTMTGSGTIAMTTDYADQLGDQLTVDNAQGTYQVKIHDYSQTPVSAEQQLKIIATGNDGATFALVGGGTDIGAYRYDMEDRGGDWYLFNTGLHANTAQAVQAAASDAAAVWYGELQPLYRRMGDLQTNPGGDGAWARTYGGKARLSPAGGTGSDLTDIGMQAGIDHRIPVAGGAVYLGAVAGTGSIDQNFHDNVGTGSANTWSVGAYATWISNSGWYGDFVAKYNEINQQINTSSSSDDPVTASYRATGYTLSAEGGRRFTLPRGWFVEPQLQLTNVYQGGASYSTSYGAAVNVASGSATTARAGVMIGQKIDYQGPSGATIFEPYVNLGFDRQFNGSTSVTVDGTQLSSSVKGNRGDISLGLMMQQGSNLQLYSAVAYGRGQNYEAPWTFDIGLRKTW